MVRKVRDIIRRLESEGWYYVGSRGDHHYYKHPTKPGKITVAGSSNDDVVHKSYASIARMAGW